MVADHALLRLVSSFATVVRQSGSESKMPIDAGGGDKGSPGKNSS